PAAVSRGALTHHSTSVRPGSLAGPELQPGSVVLGGSLSPVRGFQVVDAGAEQAHRTLARFRLVEQRDRSHRDLVRIARGLGGMTPRARGEVAVATLDGHGARDEPLAAEPPCVVAGHAGHLVADAIEVHEVLGVRALGRRRLGRPVRLDAPVVLARGQLPEPFGHAADRGAQLLDIYGADVDEPVDAEAAE